MRATTIFAFLISAAVALPKATPESPSGDRQSCRETCHQQFQDCYTVSFANISNESLQIRLQADFKTFRITMDLVSYPAVLEQSSIPTKPPTNDTRS
ncbi:hypothetical protein LTR60_001754 [Cryomyces antarcticus]|nr:hypothetical protein LTR60_001754 [Cryomyces antarcticus]